jgi:hypothetical protein
MDPGKASAGCLRSAVAGLREAPGNPNNTQPAATTHMTGNPNAVAIAPKTMDPIEIPESDPRK